MKSINLTNLSFSAVHVAIDRVQRQKDPFDRNDALLRLYGVDGLLDKYLSALPHGPEMDDFLFLHCESLRERLHTLYYT